MSRIQADLKQTVGKKKEDDLDQLSLPELEEIRREMALRPGSNRGEGWEELAREKKASKADGSDLERLKEAARELTMPRGGRGEWWADPEQMKKIEKEPNREKAGGRGEWWADDPKIMKATGTLDEATKKLLDEIQRELKEK